MTAMPSMKLTSLPSRRCVAPSATPISAKTRHAAGIENFFWTSISGLCGDWPALTSDVGARPQLGDGHLALAAGRPRSREHALGVERDDHLAELRHLVAVGIARRGAVPGAVGEHHLDGALRAIDQHPASLGEEQHRVFRRPGVGGEHAGPAAVGRDLAHVDDKAGEVFEEDPRLDLALGAVGDQLGGDLAEGLVGVGDGPRASPTRWPPSRPPPGPGRGAAAAAGSARRPASPPPRGHRTAGPAPPAARPAAPSGW